MFDVIISGAGPAGSVAATVLARAGARVLVLDRASFPRDKPCGGSGSPGGSRAARVASTA
jgi:flavin-dependent dehydrogenase